MKSSITYTWRDGKNLTVGERTLIMGILNVTADSFSDGGKWNTLDKALYHMEEMVRDGADIIRSAVGSALRSVSVLRVQR